MAEFVIGGLAVTLWLAWRDPGLLKERMRGPFQKGQAFWDKVFMAFIIVVWFGWRVLMALDAKRWNLSHMPEALNYAGAVLIPIVRGADLSLVATGRGWAVRPPAAQSLPDSAIRLDRFAVAGRAATMFFSAESVTERADEFEAACTAYARAVKPGGALIATFLIRSAGYVVADHPFPLLSLSVEAIERVFPVISPG